MTEPTPSLTGLSAIKLALMAKQARAQTQSLLQADPVAIIGMACRVPGGGDTPELFWQLLRDGTDAVAEVPPDRWAASFWFDADPSAIGKSVTKAGGFLQQIDGFDAGYFGIVPREAERMDPQQRLFLEVAIEGLDDAGLTRTQLRGSRTGVFVASYHNDYAHLQYNDVEAIEARTLTGTLHSVLANRLSHFLDLRGPSLSIDTACSSSLVATHLACQSLRFGESDVALAGGVSLIIAPELFVSMSKVGFMAPDGRCKTFDAAANGFGRGEGCGVVVLKRLADAVADGDRVLAVIRGSAVNQDGHSTVLAAPSGPAQAALLREALANAQLDASRIGFCETHGTGTALGDPIEVEAIAATIGGHAAGAGRCWLGSAKANLGHLEAAAGIAGLIKTVLVLQHEAIPPQVHYEKLNPHINLSDTRLAIADRLLPWPKGAVPRCAGTSSFGVGGTNAHVIVEEPPQMPLRATDARAVCRLLPLSAQTPQALRALLGRWRDFLAQTPDDEVDICYTAGRRRSHYSCRAAFVGVHKGDWQVCIDDFLRGDALAVAQPSGTAPRLAFVFSGQGPQWFGMGRELLASEQVFRDKLMECDALLRPLSGWSLLDELAADEPGSRLFQTEFAQPSLFALQVALTELWRSWGVVPDGVVGHSVGEIAALHTAGVLTLADALRVVWQRGRIMQQAAGAGAMAAVGMSAAQTTELIQRFADRLELAAINGPRSVVLTGEPAALNEMLATLASRGVAHQMLPVNYAFHSAQMAPFQHLLVDALAGLRGEPPTLPVYSTVTGTLADEIEFNAVYFGRNVRETVQLAGAIDAMAEDGFSVFLEIGPHPVLGIAIAECLTQRDQLATVLTSLRRGRPERETMLKACAGAYTAGLQPDWAAVQQAPGEVVSLPGYPWQRDRYWIRKSTSEVWRHRDDRVHPLLGSRLAVADAKTLVFDGDSLAAQRWLTDHRIFGRLLLPAASVMELFSSAASIVFNVPSVALVDFAMERPLLLPEAGLAPARWQTVSTLIGDGEAQLEFYEAHPKAGSVAPLWRRIASATALREGLTPERFPHDPALAAGSSQQLDAASVYAAFRTLGVAFGPSFQCLESIERSHDSAWAWVNVPVDTQAEASQFLIHPVLLDAVLQLCSVAAATQGVLPPKVLLPMGAASIMLCRAPPGRMRARVHVREVSDVALLANVRLESANGELVAAVEGMRFASADASAFDSRWARDQVDEALYVVKWQLRSRASAPLPLVADGIWLLFADNGGVGETLARGIESAGGRCICVYADVGSAGLPGRRYLDPADPAAFRRLLGESSVSQGALRGIVHLWSLDLAAFDDVSAATLDFGDRLSLGSALHLLQALSNAPASASLSVVTRGAHQVGSEAHPHDLCPRAAGLWGLVDVAAAEHPERLFRRIDLDPSAATDACDGLVQHLLASSPEPRSVALRAGKPWIAGFRRHLSTPPIPAAQPIQLTLDRPGTFDGTALRPAVTLPLQADEVRLRVLAAGLNFRDVLLTLGMYPGTEIPLGAECAGIVIEVAAGVSRFAQGELVFGYAPASLATQVAVRADFLAPVPPGMAAHEAAALPVAYLTAIYGLTQLAKLKRGERVLIHAAAGGVGMAALQVAQRIGAEVYATAGSETKRELLRDMGVRHVFDSRSLGFADDVLAATGGSGVHVVLNSLAGDFVAASLRILAQDGRFLELGKRDILSSEAMAVRRPDVEYHPYDLGSEAQTRPGLLQPMFDDLLAALREGSLRPLPVQSFALARAQDAMRHMAQARHVGKIVLLPAASGAADRFGGSGSHLITGGLGALGLATARWLGERGVRHLVLTGRRPPSEAALQVLAELRARGVAVRVEQIDAADLQAMRALFADIVRSMPPLRGVVHAAGTLRDGVLMNQRWDDARDVLSGKVHGAWVLHELTRSFPLEYFILYSAAAQWLGAAGQGLYPAANAELDALAGARQRSGLPALSVAWGAWAGGGMAADAAARGRDVWAERGLRKISAGDAFNQLETLLHDGVSCAAVLPIDWPRFLAALPPGVDASFFAELAREANITRSAEGPVDMMGSLLAMPAGQRRQGLRDFLHAQVVQALGLQAGTRLDAGVALKERGLDSLMAVELRNTLARNFGQSLPVTLLFDHPTLDALAAHLGGVLGLDAAVAQRPVRTEVSVNAKAHADVRALSDAEAEAQLLAELDVTPGGVAQ